ncbi:hypothetical protein GCM10010916_02470 [Paenibacillus abyssi]|uniref:Uncharacterized protein n=1 Tax=Paenibacillus abyssi TaxID=1340531 RepID=A0A917CIN8_9BACL|nr:hypothetical protein GCM10010916_02470 [Paenibacillus abyssi]
MNRFVRKPVVFNVENEHQRELYERVMRKCKGNFSGYIKTVLYAHERENERRENNENLV